MKYRGQKNGIQRANQVPVLKVSHVKNPIPGEVVVWNLQRDDPVVIGNITLHTEAVVHMEWVQISDMMQTRPVLVSAGRDGSIVIWSSKTVSGTLKPSLW